MQVEIKAILFNPTTDPNVWAADVYVNNVRVYCGKGHRNRLDAQKEAGEYILAIQLP